MPWWPSKPEPLDEVADGAGAADDAAGECDAKGKPPAPVVVAAIGTTATVEAEMMLWLPPAPVVMVNSVEMPEMALAPAVATAPEAPEKAMIWPVTAVGLAMSASSDEMPAVSRDCP